MNGRRCERVSHISVVPLANEQLGVLCTDPQISLQERTVTLKKKRETELLCSKRLHVKFFIERLDALYMCPCFWLCEYASIMFLNVGGLPCIQTSIKAGCCCCCCLLTLICVSDIPSVWHVLHYYYLFQLSSNLLCFSTRFK